MLEKYNRKLDLAEIPVCSDVLLGVLQEDERN